MTTRPLPSTMKAMALDRFGGPEALVPRSVPVPEIGPGEILLRVEAAGIGEWDAFERQGGYAAMLGLEPRFPYILGSEGAGMVVAVGAQVGRFAPGDRVYAVGFLNPKGGFYAEYAAVEADLASPLPAGLTSEQAGAMSGVGLTALRGLEDTLELKRGESLLVFGASGGVGHLAVQLAGRMGARVFAVASGADGVALVRQLGAEAVVDGRSDEVLEAARAFAPAGLDAALFTAGGEVAEAAREAVRPGGRIAYPNGVPLAASTGGQVRLLAYNADPDSGIVRRFAALAGSGSLQVHVARSFGLEQAAEAHRALESHYLGKLVLRVG